METASWSYERLLSFSPDTGTLEQARRLFFSKKWTTLEGNGEWLWGEYTTAYGDQFKAAVRLEPPLFKCSCKSRRRPCKHSLSLILLFLNRADNWIVKEELPDWLLQQIQTRKSSKTTVINPAKQEKRILLMDQGVAELEKWLLNIIQQGVAQFTNPSDWENIATRMVDSKLGTIARQLRYCQSLFQQEDWLDDVVKELGSLYLFVKAWQQKTERTTAQKNTLLQVAGWNIRKENVLKHPSITDNWLVLGLTTGNEEKLTFRRTWLRGENTNRFALILDFSYNNAGFENHWVVGAVLAGQLVYYPGEASFRALLKNYVSSKVAYDFKAGYSDFNVMGVEYSQALASSPWLQIFPCLFNDVWLQYDKEKVSFYLWDKANNGIPIAVSPVAWQLLAISGSKPITIFGEYNGRFFIPLTVVDQGRVIALK